MKKRISDICQVINGRAYKQNELLQQGKYRVLRVGNFFTSDKWYYSDFELAEDKYCDKGDLLFAWSATFGPKIWDGEKVIYHYHIWKMIPDVSVVDKWYLYYWLKKNVSNITAGVHGSVMAHITKSEMENFEIDIPPLRIQQVVASILRAIDDKIRNNKAINDNLVQQALALYREMFINTSNTQRKTCKAQEFFDIAIGKTPPRKEHQWFSTNPSDVTWVSISDMGSCGTYISKSSEQLTAEAIKKFNIKIIPNNTVILSFKLTVGRVAITHGEMATNEAIAHFKTDNPVFNEYLYCYLKEFNYQTMGSTSSIATAVNSKIIKAMPFVVPTNDEIAHFHGLVGPMFSQILVNQIENDHLTELRNSLLPKLMSGEIDVSDIEL